MYVCIYIYMYIPIYVYVYIMTPPSWHSQAMPAVLGTGDGQTATYISKETRSSRGRIEKGDPRESARSSARETD